MPAPPEFRKIDPQEVQELALKFDTEGYRLSDEDFAKRFPGLVAGREFAINDALGELKGGMSPIVTDALASAGLDTNFGNTSFKQAKNMGKRGTEILSLQNRSREYFQRLLAQNPQRQFGLTGQDQAHIALANTGGQNVYNQGIYRSRVADYNEALQRQAQNTAATLQAATSLAGIAGKFYQQTTSPYLGAQGYGNPWAANLYQGAGRIG